MAVASLDSNQRVRVCFGRSETRLAVDETGVEVWVGLPHLGGAAEEVVLEVGGGVVSEPKPGTALVTGDDWMAGAVVRPWSGPLDELAAAQYREVLRHTRGWNMARAWNYLPHINCETTGLENYRRFNLGRWQAYHEVYGDGLPANLPAASAVGLREDVLVTVFVATRGMVERLENPQQVPAWRYPAAYGPKSPSFVRATRAVVGGRGWLWVSGTASIRGHESVAVGDVAGQLAVTIENLNAVMAAAQLPPITNPGRQSLPIFTKVYLRHADDWERVRAGLGAAAADATCVVADICRAELALEIEVAVAVAESRDPQTS